MNKITLVVSAVALLLSLYTIVQTRQERVAYVDSTKLLNQYRGMLDARQQYQQKARVWQAKVDTLAQGVQVALQRYEQRVARMSGVEKQVAREAIARQQQQLVRYQQSIQETAQQEDQQSTQLVLTRVNAFLQRYGKENNYQLILVANQTGNIGYAQPQLDVTEEVVQQLNQEYQAVKVP